MHEGATSVMDAWSNFYVIAGSAAGGLTGLMFVTVTLIAGRRVPQLREGVATFSTPTVVHFAMALVVSAVLTVPWRSLVQTAVTLDVIGLYGVGYAVIVLLRTRRQTVYEPLLEDWLFYAILPLVAYVVIVAAALAFPAFPGEALFALAAATILLIVIGIHNAWDIVTWVTLRIDPPTGQDAGEPRAQR